MVKLFVSRLSDDVMHEHLKALFAQFGTVDSASKIIGKDIGFVHMPNEKEAYFAMQ